MNGCSYKGGKKVVCLVINMFKELIYPMLTVLICKHITHTFFNNINLSVNKGRFTLSKTSAKTTFLKILITVRKRSCGKVTFSHLSVSHSVHSGACMVGGACLAGGHMWWGRAWQERCAWPGGMHGSGEGVRGRRDDHCSGR